MRIDTRIILIWNLIKSLIRKHLIFIDWLWVYCALFVVLIWREKFWFWNFFSFNSVFAITLVFLEHLNWVQISLYFEKVWFYFLVEIVFVETVFFYVRQLIVVCDIVLILQTLLYFEYFLSIQLNLISWLCLLIVICVISILSINEDLAFIWILEIFLESFWLVN